MNGAERKVIGTHKNGAGNKKALGFDTASDNDTGENFKEVKITAPSTEAAKQWAGWGSALKPANEPVCMARKPFDGPIAENLVRHGTGALNIDETRIGNEKRSYTVNGAIKGNNFGNKATQPARERETVFAEGRWPSNVIMDEEAAKLLGEAQRFFYVAKPGKKERDHGLEDMPAKKNHTRLGSGLGNTPAIDGVRATAEKNFHPTVKPVALMGYLIKMVTPKNGTVLDPFMGSGSTGVAANKLGFNFVGVELSPEYFEIAKARIAKATRILEMPSDRVRAKASWALAKKKLMKSKRAKSLTR
jgi:site-specific DNA-methyltransferase (adenine-specific)